jgi:hypothetical protein
MSNTLLRNLLGRGIKSGTRHSKNKNEKRSRLLACLVSIIILFSIFSGFLITSTPLVSAANDVDPNNSSVVAVNSPQAAGEHITINITLKDASGNNITDAVAENFSFAYSGNASNTVTADSFDNHVTGLYYTWDIADEVDEGPVTVTVTAKTVQIAQTVNLTWLVGEVSPDESNIMAINSPQIAGDPITITIILKDGARDNITDAVEEDFEFTYEGNRGPTLSENDFITYNNGTYTWNITNTVAEGPITVIVTVQSVEIEQNALMTWMTGNIDAVNSRVMALNSPRINNTAITVLVSLNDGYGNNITNATEGDFEFTYVGNESDTISESDFVNNGDGTYIWEITDTEIEGPVTVTVTAKTVVITQTAELEWVELILPLVTITHPVNNSYYHTLPIINGTAIDEGFGIDRVDITIYNASSKKYWTGAAWSTGVQWLTTTKTYGSPSTWTYDSAAVTWYNGTHYWVNATAVDNESNPGMPVSSRFLYDTKAPTVSIAFNTSRPYFKEGDVVRVYVNFTEDGSGINESSILVTIHANGYSLSSMNASSLMKTDNTHWYHDLTISSGHDGKLNISVAATDNVSLPLVGIRWNDSKSIDTTAPTATIGYNTSAPYFKAGTRVKLFVNFTEAVSGMNESTIKLHISTNGDGDLHWTTITKTDNTHWTWNWTIPTGSDDDGEIIVKVNGSDNAGNSLLDGTYHSGKTIDNTAPTGNITQSGYYNDSLVNFTGTANDSGSGIANVTISLYNVTNATYWTGSIWQPSNHQLPVIGTTTWYFPNGSLFPVFSNGTTYRVILTVNDTVGNSNSSADSSTILYDTFPPQLSDITVESITTSSATITWTTNENTTSLVEYGTTVSYESWSNSSTYTTIHSRPLSGLSSGTTYHYCVLSSDPAGNHVNSSDFTFITDTEGPGGGGAMPPSSGQPPMASAGGPYFGYENQSITFDGSRSNSTQGTIAGYRWDWTNDGIYDTDWSTSPLSTHNYTTAGSYIVLLQVKDSEGFRDTDTAYVNITSIQPLPPVADAEGPYSGLTYQDIHFDGSGSLGTDGVIVNYTWDFGDGTFSYSISPVHSYESGGTFSVTLTVTDSNGLQDRDTTTVTIAPDANRDNVSDIIEQTIGANITPSDMRLIQIRDVTYYLIDTNHDGIFDVMYNPLENRKAMLGQQDDKQLIDIDDDGIWDYIYDPVLGTLTPYTAETPMGGFPWIMVGILAITLVIVALVLWLYKSGRL